MWAAALTEAEHVAEFLATEAAAAGAASLEDDFTGRAVFKTFEGHGAFGGTVAGRAGDHLWVVVYEDGDGEELTRAEVEGILVPSRSDRSDEASAEGHATAVSDNAGGGDARDGEVATDDDSAEGSAARDAVGQLTRPKPSATKRPSHWSRK
jgi:hypothetical protein